MIRKHFLTSQFAKFLLVGGIAAGVNFGSRIILSDYFSFRWSVVMAYIIGMLTAYILSRLLVFEKSGKSTISELYYFSIINFIAIIQVWIISVGLAEYIFPTFEMEFYAEEISHLVGLSFPIFTSFLGHKYVTFKARHSDQNIN